VDDVETEGHLHLL